MKNYSLTPAQQREKLEETIEKLDHLAAVVRRLGGEPSAIEIFEAEITAEGQDIKGPTPLLDKIVASEISKEITKNRNLITEVLNSIFINS